MYLMKQKINLATIRLRNLVTVSGSFLGIIHGISATDLETHVSTPSTRTIPHGVVGSSINYSPISELASQRSTGAPLPGGNLQKNEDADDIALPNEPTCEALPPKTPVSKLVSGSQGYFIDKRSDASTPVPKVVSGSQGGAD